MAASAVAARADDNLFSIFAQGLAPRTDRALLLLPGGCPVTFSRPERHPRSAVASTGGLQCPKAIGLVDELPRNAMGKVQKALLRTEYSRLFSKS